VAALQHYSSQVKRQRLKQTQFLHISHSPATVLFYYNLSHFSWLLINICIHNIKL